MGVRLDWRLRLSETWKRTVGRGSNRQVPAVEALATLCEVNLKDKRNDVSLSMEEALAKELPAVESPMPPKNPSRGTRNECKTLDAREGYNGNIDVKDSTVPFNPSVSPSNTMSIFDEYALVITRNLNELGQHTSTTLKIQSPFVIEALRKIVKDYPSNPVHVTEDSITIEGRPELIYHYRQELAQYGQEAPEDSQTRLHMDYLLTYLRIILGSTLEKSEKYLCNGLIKYSWLWMLFRPGCLLYSPSEDQLYHFERSEYTGIANKCAFHLHCTLINYDGTEVGSQRVTKIIPGFENTRELSSLPVIPLDYHDDPESLKQRLRERGRKFLDLRGVHQLCHSKSGRVMIDCHTHQERVFPKDKPKLYEERIKLDKLSECACAVCKKQVNETPDDYDHELRELSEDELMITSSQVYGFSLMKHTWEVYQIDELSEINWTKNAIESLVMDQDQKKVILSLVTSPIFMKGISTDELGWRGKGLVVLLHGAPGTGKTLTAECVCEHLKRPLYTVNCGELGTDPGSLETSLKEILELSKLWDAIILIDEADVFLEERTSTDIERNSLVSVFLRVMERFDGMLFLTTNRAEHFDDAFTSRIHLALNYPELGPSMRRDIWVNSLKRFPQEQLNIRYNSAEIDSLAEEPLNGRVISYAVRTAKALAEADNQKLAFSHLREAIGVYQKFNKKLAEQRRLK